MYNLKCSAVWSWFLVKCYAHLWNKPSAQSRTDLPPQSVPKLICNATNPILHPFLAPDKHYCVLLLQICLPFYKYIHGNIKYTLFCGEETWFPSLNITTLKIYSYVTTINNSFPFACAQYTLYWSLILTSGLFPDCRVCYALNRRTLAPVPLSLHSWNSGCILASGRAAFCTHA